MLLVAFHLPRLGAARVALQSECPFLIAELRYFSQPGKGHEQRQAKRTELPSKRLLGWAELCSRKYGRWQERYGKANEHNGLVPRDHWLEDWEKLSIIKNNRISTLTLSPKKDIHAEPVQSVRCRS